jgi:dihydrofolate synthase/folylpolyglutamate synthase
MAGKGRTGDDITPYLQSLNQMGAKLGLERITKLLDALGRPQDSFKAIIVGGTSGKGSTVAMISSVLTEARYRTGRYTSPHLASITERICIDRKEISEKDFARMITIVREAVDGMKRTKRGRGSKHDGGIGREGGGVFDHPTFFEVVTAAAFCYFKEKKVDFAVLEVGLGGRLDATNTTSDANTLVSVITNISLEHTAILGDTVEKIAYEKAGIIRNNGLLVTAARDEALGVFEKVCSERNARVLVVGKGMAFRRIDAGTDGQVFDAELAGKGYTHLHIPLLGRHQLENASCAIGAVGALRLHGVVVDDKAIALGLEKTKWPGRMEVAQKRPLVILDGAKDAGAMKRLRETIEEDVEYQKLILVIGISSDKDIAGMVGAIAPLADRSIITAHKVAGRAADIRTIAREMKKQGVEHLLAPDVKDAVKRALSLAAEDDLVLVTGSLFTVAEARELWHKTKARWGRELSETPKR